MENNCNTMTTNIIFWNKATSKKSESIVAKDGEKQFCVDDKNVVGKCFLFIMIIKKHFSTKD